MALPSTFSPWRATMNGVLGSAQSSVSVPML